MAELTGTGLVADDLFLMAHDDVSGRPFLQRGAIGLGLAAGLLAELMLADRLGVTCGIVVVAVRPGEPADQLAADILRLVRAEPELHPVSDWLAFLARSATADVTSRLVHAGYLQQTGTRRSRRGVQWQPVDPDCAFASHGRARPALGPSGAPVYSVVLAGLAVACGLGPRLLPYGPPDARQHLDLAIAGLVPSLAELIGQTQAAVDKAVLTHRI